MKPTMATSSPPAPLEEVPLRGVRLPAPARRRQLLDAALGAFAERSFHAVSMEEVAVAAGITKPVLYQHFGSKRALYLELLSDVGSQLMVTIAKATASARGPRQQVEAGFGAYFAFVATHDRAFRLLFGGGARRDQEFRQAVQRVEDSIAEAVAARIEADIDPDHRRQLAYGVVGLAEATARHWQAGPPSRPGPEVLARRVADLAWAGLRGVHRD
ncbi:MAG: TetR/AcrR family transcriptional regulator [Acidimicrobiales bacterium]